MTSGVQTNAHLSSSSLSSQKYNSCPCEHGSTSSWRMTNSTIIVHVIFIINMKGLHFMKSLFYFKNANEREREISRTYTTTKYDSCTIMQPYASWLPTLGIPDGNFPYRTDPRYHVGSQLASIGFHVRKTCKHFRHVYYLSITFTLYSIELERDTLVAVFDSREVDVRGVQRIYLKGFLRLKRVTRQRIILLLYNRGYLEPWETFDIDEHHGRRTETRNQNSSDHATFKHRHSTRIASIF